MKNYPSLSSLLSELTEQWGSQKRNRLIEELMNFQTSSLWNSDLLIRGQAQWTWHRNQPLKGLHGDWRGLENANCIHPRERGQQCLCMHGGLAKMHWSKGSFTYKNMGKYHSKVGVNNFGQHKVIPTRSIQNINNKFTIS